MDRSKQLWIPDFFVDFEQTLCSSDANRKIASKNAVRIVPKNASYRVDGMAQAASKWRVAAAVNGLDASIMEHKSVRKSPEVPEDKISSKLCESYSAQLVISLAVFAFETYAICFAQKGRDWNQHKQVVFKATDQDLSDELRRIPDSHKIRDKIFGFLDRDNQRQRVTAFFDDGKDEYLYDVCHFVRHGYAHGALQGYESLIDIAPKLKSFILNGIRDHTTSIADQCRNS